MAAGQRSNARFEELEAAEVIPVKVRVSRSAHRRSIPVRFAEGGSMDPTSGVVTETSDVISMDATDPIGSTIPPSWVVAAVVAFLVAIVVGDDGPWIVVVPGLTALCSAWLDRRIPFSFAEGFIGYAADPEPARGAVEEDRPSARQQGVPAAS
jgi:hypothetical protein